MPWSGSGSYSPPVASFPEVNGTVIDANRYNPTITDLANGIQATLAKNGENTPIANLPMGGFKHTGAADAVQAGEYLTYAQVVGVYATLANLASTASASLGGGLVGFGALLTYASGTVGAGLQNRATVHIDEMAGADDTARFSAAVTNVVDGGVIVFKQGKTYNITNVDVTGKRITLMGYGATITCNNHANGTIYKTDHGKKLSVFGLKFVGTGVAIKYVTATSGTQFDDFEAGWCAFENADYGIYLDGPRENRIAFCHFEGVTQKGIYRVRCVNSDVIGCYWKNTVYGVNDEGDGSPFSAGLMLKGGTMIGVGTGVYSQRSDFLSIIGCMIDYCDAPVKLRGVDNAVINANYISSRTTAPAIDIDRESVSLDNNREIRIIGGNILIQHSTDNTADCIKVAYVATGEISQNSVTFWRRTGIALSNSTFVRIEHNKISFDPASGAATKSAFLESAAGSNTNHFNENETTGNITPLSALTYRNSGEITQSEGEAVAGSGISTFNVAHGCNFTPEKYEVTLTPTNAEAAGKNPYINTVDATNISIGFTTATAANAGVAWRVRKRGS